MSGLDNDTVKDFNDLLYWLYNDFERNSKCLLIKIRKLIKQWEKEDDLVET